MNNSYLANQNKFSLNLSAVRRVSGQAKQVPTSGREKDSMDMAGISGTLYSERRKNLDNPSNNLNKLSTRANRYVQEKKPKPDESGRDDSNSLVMTSAVRRKDITSAMGIRIKKQ